MRAVLVDPQPERAERVRGVLEGLGVTATVASDWDAVALEPPPDVVIVAADLAAQHPAPPGIPLPLPESVVRLALLPEGHGHTPEFLAAGFHGLLYEPVTSIEVARALALARALKQSVTDAAQERQERLQALRMLDTELLLLVELSPSWLPHGLARLQRLLAVPAIAVWEWQAESDSLRCIEQVGLSPAAITAAELTSRRRGQLVLTEFTTASVQPTMIAQEASHVLARLALDDGQPVFQTIAFPFRESTRLQGCITFSFVRDRPYHPDDLPLYDAASALVRSALALARLRHETLTSQRLFTDVADQLSIGIIVCTTNGIVTFCNHQAQLLLGEPGIVPGQPFPPRWRMLLDLDWDELAKRPAGSSPQPLRARVRGAGGRWQALEGAVRVVELPDRWGRTWAPHFLLSLNDVTQTERYVLELELLHELTQMVAERRDLEAAFRLVAQRLHDTFGYAYVGLGVLSPDGQRLIGQTFYADGEIAFNEWQVSRGVTGRAIRENRSLLIPDVWHDPDYFPPSPEMVMQSEVVAVLRRDGVPIGVLNIESALGHQLDESDLRLAEQVAAHLELLMGQLELTERLARQAMTDPLTGLANRRALLYHLERLSRVPGKRAALLLIDFDGFKQLNDQYGHLVADAILQQAAERLTRSLRPHDLLARYGGDELAVLLEDVSEGDAREVAERLRRAIAAQPFTADDTPVTLTISLGIARFPEHGQTPDALLHAADTALYRAKAGGRNRVVMADIAEG